MQTVEEVKVKTRGEAVREIDKIKENNPDAQASFKKLVVSTTNIIYKFKIKK